jgi:hypothetical protein
MKGTSMSLFYSRKLVLFSCLALSSPMALLAQSAQIGGIVRDESRAAIPHASIVIESLDTHEKSETKSNGDGVYSLPSLQPGRYQLTVQAPGFEQKIFREFKVDVSAKASLDVVLKVGSEAQSVTVDATNAQMNTTDASVSTVIDRKFVENLPLNGRSFQSLLTLIPGVVAVPSSGAGASGQLAVNGMRSESNNFQIDGVSANSGVNSSSPGAGAGYSGSLPSSTALGTTQSLISIDALEEFRGTTSTYSAELGRVPGGQFSFRTRSGTSDFHGTIYNYFRNDAMDANSYFNKRNNIRRAVMRQNDFGGTFGGPVIIPGLLHRRDRTFFFFSYEGLRLRAPQEATTTYVPNATLRATAPAALRPVLNAFPVAAPGALAAAGQLSAYVASYSQPSVINANSLRVDHALSDRWRVFGRYGYTPSSTTSRYSTNMAQVNQTAVNAKALTLGSTNMFSSRITNELRFNLSWNDQITSSYIDNFGGATPLSIGALPGLSAQDWALFSYRPGVSTGFWLNPQNNRQKQYNVVDTLTYTLGRHSLKFGVDWRRIGTNSSLPGFYESPFYLTAGTNTAEQQLFNNAPSLFTLYRSNGNMAPVYKNFSLFAQDEWKATDRLSLSLGLRWDVNPAPRDANGNQPFTIDQISNLATTRIAPQGSELWKTAYGNFAPRFGFAYQAQKSPGHETTFRGGAGLFFDASSVQASQGYWYGIGITGSANMNGQPFPVSAAQIQATPLPSATPSLSSTSNIYGFDPNLKSPLALQWNGAVEQGLGQSQTLTVSYVGSLGDRLLTARQFFPFQYGNPLFPSATAAYLYATINASSSSYNSLQAQYRRAPWHGLQMLTSYTWAHAIDDSTSNFTLSSLLRASSNYDIRHNLQAAITYNLPSGYKNAWTRSVLGGWALDSRISTRSALPVDVLASTQVNASGASYSPHPNLVPGQPLYKDVANAPGGRAINPAAFSLAAAGAEGNAGRNVARGFSSAQMDLSFRREFHLTERVKTTFRAEAFNALNHANFGAINGNIQTSTTAQPFGWASGTQASQLGGLNALYQTGGPRSMQVALKVQF